MTPVDARKSIVARLESDLVGPLVEDEVLEGKQIRPSDVYLTGLLWPIGERMDGRDDDGSSGDDEDDENPSAPSLVGQQRPCSMGVSFAVHSDTAEHSISLTAKFATYDHSSIQTTDGSTLTRWVRKPHKFTFHDIRLPVEKPIKIKSEELGPEVEIHFRTLSWKGGLLVTITLINRSTPEEHGRDIVEALTMFQTSLEIVPKGNTRIVPRPPLPTANDEDERSGRLLYRDCHEFAAGHQCSATWDVQGGTATRVSTSWLPCAIVPAYKEDGSSEFEPMVSRGSLDAHRLSEAGDAELYDHLKALPDAYNEWIKERAGEIEELSPDIAVTARAHLEACRNVHARIYGGIEAIRMNRHLRDAFRYANAAMALQHSWKLSADERMLPEKQLRWRPFQLGFILLAADSSCNIASPERDILDLLWFPTGGGKTEAYLAIIAMLAWHRRLSHAHPDEGAGNAAVMRYTLRLLTAQQFERASSMILACELIRRGLAFPRLEGTPFGTCAFSIGLWVGRDATPNNFETAMSNRGNRDGSTAEQIEECPCCHSPTRWNYDEAVKQVQPYCSTVGCALGGDFGLWPILTVDSDIYRVRPTLLIGTVDKFAQLPFKTEVADLFGFGTSQSTDLIIQDELHLISGALGTVTGLYETAFDWLLRKNGKRPKVIGSTATIRRAEEQVRALFDRRSCQFPPPGLSYENSGFAMVDSRRPGRMYVGVTTAGRSAKFALQATAGSLLQSGGPALGVPDQVRDGYATLLCYFNSLRELGGAIVQMLDDVPDSISLYSERRTEKERAVSIPRELTSRVSQKEIIEILSELRRTTSEPDYVDVVLATNMVSVGVDVPRLGAMLVNGQPKTRSEYIQSTSRVGRSGYPGLVVCVLNAAKARDRSHFETFPGWHQTIYRDVEATSVTPFASRARDRALHAVLVSMIRHGDPAMSKTPKLALASDKLLGDVVAEIERRIKAIDPRECADAERMIDEDLQDWDARAPTYYLQPFQSSKSLLQSAEAYASKIAAGRLPGAAWPTMNTMRSVEPSSRFRITEVLADAARLAARRQSQSGDAGASPQKDQPRWRRKNA